MQGWQPPHTAAHEGGRDALFVDAPSVALCALRQHGLAVPTRHDGDEGGCGDATAVVQV